MAIHAATRVLCILHACGASRLSGLPASRELVYTGALVFYAQKHSADVRQSAVRQPNVREAHGEKGWGNRG